MLTYDVLIIGSGGAGLYAALESRRQEEISVAVVSKVYATRSHTGAAQGGVTAALATLDPSDTWLDHWFDTVNGADYLADQNAVEIMCREAPMVVREMEHWGCPFSRTDDGRIAQRPFGGASKPRACYSADRVGHVILHTLYEQGIRYGVNYLNEWFVLSLLHNGSRCVGVTALDIRSGRLHAIRAKAVVLATGGHGRIYWLCTSNALGNTGDRPALTSEVDPKVGLLTAGRWCTSNGAVVSCTQMAPVTTDKVGSNILNHVPMWNGSQLVSGSIFDDGTDVVVLGNLTVESTREAKEDIRDLGGGEAVEALKGLTPVKFAYKANRGERHVGFIAEDVPDLVATKGRKGLSPMDIVAVLTKVVQEKSSL